MKLGRPQCMGEAVSISQGGGWGNYGFFGDSEYKGKGRLWLIMSRTPGLSFPAKEIFMEIKKKKKMESKTPRQINSKSVHDTGLREAGSEDALEKTDNSKEVPWTLRNHLLK